MGNVTLRRLKCRRVEIIPMSRNVRSVIREHLRDAKLTVENDLSKWWSMQPHSAHRIMYDAERTIGPLHIEAVIKNMQLDDFDANELRLLGAQDVGWKINPELLRY